MNQWGWWLVLCWVVPSFGQAGVIVSTFSAPDAIDKLEFNHLTVDEHTGRVYVGAVNKLYQLVSDLELVQEVETGPSMDSPECSFIECPANAEKKLTDNVNKALVIDRSQGKLISCGSLSQGVCTVRSLENIKKDVRRVQEPVVANNSTASTVAFIAEGPSDQTRGNPLVLYVGVTYTGNSYYRAEVPAVSSRSLNPDNMFQLARTAVTTGTRMFVNSLSREKYPIHYVFGFSHEGFSYFLTIQMKFSNGGPSAYISKLVRVCQNDPDYYSYTEIPLECKDREGEHYSLVQAAYMGRPGSDLASELGITAQDDALFVVFSKPTEEYSSQPMASSALCIYSLKLIRRMFLQNIQKCFNGKANRGLDFISPAQGCTATKLTTIDETFCGMDVNSPLGGEVPVIAIAAKTWNEHLTAVAATSTSEYTVVFLGTANGHLKKVTFSVEAEKVVVESGRTANEYSDMVIDEGSPVNADLRFDRKHMHLYVMTEKKVSKVKVQECEVYGKCSGCLGAKDPYCGWCSLENKCSLLSNCRDAASDPLYWISYKDGRCTTITSVNPKQLQRTTARTLQLEIENLPSTLKGQFQCAFTATGKTLLTKASRDKSSISCYTPRTDLLPNILHGQHHFTAILSVRLKDEHDFVATNFTFFDCNTYSSCTDCVSSDFPCDWCVDGHRCTHDTAENCRNDILVTGVSRIGPSIRSGPGYCPLINSTSEGGTEILVAWGSTQKIKVRVDNIAQFIVQTRFGCQFNIEGRVSIKEALLVGNIIYCEEMKFTYNSPRPNITATFAVIWGNSKPLDNPDNIHVLIYRCREMADNCGICLALPEKYGCGWCQSSSRCEVETQCEQGKGVWLDRTETCPNPKVTHFYPKYGPWEGGTNITIEGINLGKTFDDIYGGITVAGISCQPFQESYIQTRQITCKLDGPGSKNENKKGPVVVKVRDFRGQSVEEFRFVDPRITRIKPTFGPKSGGTRLTLYGEHMNAGSSITASIQSKPCRIIKTMPTYAECITSASDSLVNGTVKMMFDQGRRELEGQAYAYVRDPEIHTVLSGPETGVQSPKGIPSGGIHITVKGSNLDSIQQPQMIVYAPSTDGDGNLIKYTSKCKVISAVLMKCLSPSMEVDGTELNANDPKRLKYGFIMDDVKSVLDHTKKVHSYFSLYPDPVFHKFPEETKYYKSDYLTINGEDLARASQELDVKVYIGTEMCNVTSLSMSQLTCRPPSEQPPGVGADGKPDRNKIPQVKVVVGANLEFDIGFLSYTGPGVGDGTLPKSVIIPLTVGGGLLLLVVIGILIAYRHKSTESSRVLRSMQEQMDVLEMKVAAECKEAFAELQTEMTDLTSDLMLGGIPFLDYSTYTMKILFPRIEDHPVLRRDVAHPDFSRRDRERGIKLFNQLILNKTFLLNFIRTLESNRYFSMKDRVNVASLIMVTLQSKMEYCTDILKTLLAELIEKCMDGKSHPKLLLRRTESVAEKMLSAWFTFLLYKFLRECAGEPLFLLYRAIKTQVEKGPVDAVTCEGRYSLSEEKLIRQSLDFKRMVVRVSMAPNTVYSSGLDPNTDHTDVPVKVLDCDTISQVKDKALDTIYRNTPFSQRPPRDDLDLEWRTGMTGRIILSDEDSTTKTENGWRKLNTLCHYKVPDMANLTLVPKQSSMYNLSILSERMYDPKHQHKYETLNFSKLGSGSPPPSRATSPLNHDGIGESGIRTWHLVRHHDDQNQKEGDRRDKMVSEIYLTRLLTTKGTLQEFVNDLFETIFSVAYRGSALPLAIKYMFDFLDDQALHHAITDPEVVHTWKSNSLPLRFWVNLIKNPEFVFDIHKSNIVDSSLSVIAQTFMDSCSTSDHRLGKDSPSSKLLYARDIPKFKSYVESYYAEIKQMPAISDQDMNAMLAEESRLHTSEFNTIASVWELFTYALKYNEQLMSALEEDEFSKRQRLAYKLEQVLNLMAEDTNA